MINKRVALHKGSKTASKPFTKGSVPNFTKPFPFVYPFVLTLTPLEGDRCQYALRELTRTYENVITGGETPLRSLTLEFGIINLAEFFDFRVIPKFQTAQPCQ